jgi:MioC protein
LPEQIMMSTGQIGIFVATMTGTAEMCAEEVEGALNRSGLPAERHLMDGLDAAALAPYDMIVIISSTYGHGDVPDNGQALFRSIEDGGTLAGKPFAVFGLGDRTYAATFCEAGRKWDALFAGKGATRIVPLVQHDACSGTLAEDIAAEWATSWAPLLRLAA